MSGVQSTDVPALFIAGTQYTGWTAFTFERAIDRMVSAATFTVSVNPQAQSAPWPIDRWQSAAVKINSETILTGYVEHVEPEFSPTDHKLTVSVCSITQDLVECCPDIASGQFRNYTLSAIASAICKPFGITVSVQAQGATTLQFPLQDVTLQRGETAFSFLGRLGKLAGVLLTDDAQGRLVLTSAGTTRAATALVQGQNILSARGLLTTERRFSEYIVKGQNALGSTAPSYQDGEPVTPVQNALRAVVADSAVPRYRPHVSIAESQLSQQGMQQRAQWECDYAAGRSSQAEITVQGWRQTASGALWWDNLLATVNAPFLQLSQDLLIARLRMTANDREGRTTELTLGPVEGYTPEPGAVKIHTKRGKKTVGYDWSGAGGI
jgi:prophage tail gpP-like protein